MKVTVEVNGTTYSDDVEPRLLLVHYIRENCGLTGTNVGCDTSSCGACTIHLNGVPTRSCMTPVSTVGKMKVTTIEGLAAPSGKLHPVQQAWSDLDVAQCGYCQAGQIMTAAALLKDNPKPNDEDIDGAMAGNLCRCATYMRIRAGIKLAAGLTTVGKGGAQ